jgi:urease accessory protein
MLEFIKKLDNNQNAKADFTICLDYEQRVKARIKTTTIENKQDVGIFMSRGTILRGGDKIATTGEIVAEIVANKELVSSVLTTDSLALAKACYHLGNRHVELQVEKDSLHYKPDHVLDEMLRGFGLSVITEKRVFSPEVGAYHAH